MTDMRVRLVAVEVWCGVAGEIDAAMVWTAARDAAYASPVGRVVIEEILELADHHCAGCDTVASTVRPTYYPRDEATQRHDFLCSRQRYMLHALCSACAEKHDDVYNGRNVPETGPYIL
jgi:hypothetical protein